ncbi:MAG: hypothetical protein ACLPZR_21240 [Solirubrobacteraceae bacterium]
MTRSHGGLSAGELLIQNRCRKGEKKLSWDQQGVQGAAGAPGAEGPQGPGSPTAWGYVSGGGTVQGVNLSVVSVSNGVFTLSAGGPCTNARLNAETVTPADAIPDVAGGQPIASAGEGNLLTPSAIEVVTGYLLNGRFTQESEDFNIAVYCTQN